MQINDYIKNKQNFINDALEEYFLSLNPKNKILYDAMHYSVFNGGKRIRPILCLSIAECYSTPIYEALSPAIAIELFHCSTLVHDDLPCMDNDVLRRGKPTTHVKYGEANAILAGDALLIESFNILAKKTLWEIAAELSNAIGLNGVIAGQVADLAAENQNPCEEMVNYIHFNKTSILIRAAIRFGALSANVSQSDLDLLSSYGEKIGMAFQIQDDILDEIGLSKNIGKNAKSDYRKSKMTYPHVHGMNAAKQKVKSLTNDAIKELSLISRDTTILEKVALFLLERDK